MTAKTLRLNYRSVDQFIHHYERLIKGRIYLRSKTPLAEKTPLVLQINVSGIEETVPLETVILKCVDADTAVRLNKPPV